MQQLINFVKIFSRCIKIALVFTSLIYFRANAQSPAKPIDRKALVTRHNIEWNDVTGQIPLGNGEFCFNADGTGLQTFGGNTMSHWGWHSFPLPDGVHSEDVPRTGTFQKGRSKGLDVFPDSLATLRQWMFDNPHIINLARFRFVKTNGKELDLNDIHDLSRTYDLWSGLLTSNFSVDGQPVQVLTCVNPVSDMISVSVKSPLCGTGKLAVVIDFPYPSIERGKPWVGDFTGKEKDKTSLLATGYPYGRTDFVRNIDATVYYASLTWSTGCSLKPLSSNTQNTWQLASQGVNSLEFTCAFSGKPIVKRNPAFGLVAQGSKLYWPQFWNSGGAIDLSESKDPRWKELERRIVLSQYLTAVQSAGSYPPAEGGLMGIGPWRGQFHMEMIWWHLAHFALWDRWQMAENALQCYWKFKPQAGALARQLGYKGLKWPKSVGPEGRSAPWVGNQVLLWKEPHPIFFAELEYRLNPTQATLLKWEKIIEGTAEHMADYAVLDKKTGIYHLDPVMPPSEQGVTRDDVFDLAYWSWGLNQAQLWRERMALPRNIYWDKVIQHLAPLPVDSGVFVHSAEWLDTYTKRAWEHPDPIGVFGMLPPQKNVDSATAHETLLKIRSSWDWKRCWGWDFPWTAMAAARLGEPELAIDALLIDAGTKNYYDKRGVCMGGPVPYLPGNGGLLYAVAMMAAGWEGAPERDAPGFPNDGSWVVRWEGLKRAL